MRTVLTNKVLKKPQLSIVILLCIGYFVDFYDLTIFSASYSNVIKDLFYIYDTQQIQLLFLKINNYYIAGIIVGSITFGIIGDKIGRTSAIRYSILLYSFSIIFSVFVHNVSLFIFLRFLAGAGLASEFATSTVLISELFDTKFAGRSTSLLYFCGVLGGITATFMASISWKILFLCGGVAGLILYMSRKSLYESPLFLKLEPAIFKGKLLHLIIPWANFFKLIKLLIIILPFYFLLSAMFIYPSFMGLNTSLAESIRILLLGFFLGNLISSISCLYILDKFKDYRIYLLISIIGFCLFMSIFKFIDQKFFFFYSLCLGLLGGGYPTVWMQLVTKNYGTNQRNLSSNVLYALGRGSGIGFNLLFSSWIVAPQNFQYYCLMSIGIITLMVLIVLKNTGSYYNKNVDFIEGFS